MYTLDQQSIEAQVANVQHGFKEMQQSAQGIIAQYDPQDSFSFAKELFASEKHQVRMVGVFVMGYVAHQSNDVLTFLRHTVSIDSSWQVQEILAQAFNQYCHDIGYEQALSDIKDWLTDSNPNVKRAVTEGLRIWNRRDYFKQYPAVAISLLSEWKDHESEYLRKSVGNALRDISRTEKALVQQEVTTWNVNDPKISFTYKLACKFL
ncbi:DNA alkylation repair protein [Tengunoibacter tsumagoiensis]|uniref:DNA alkylation repair protein n=1 Tax=Tengunoibacter tsumagoiensis TaxID=2014871 RepID=A0A402A8J7_9CHLR|nr:DNA alkylation repair protein [Tengunoibacter tsumagoiensis]GCE15480.1 hypothetical protein KTT_53390 [Tengunoibacter tsumagoiensis]